MMLPAHAPGATVEAISKDLHVAPRTFYRLVAHVRSAGIDIERSYLPDGRRGYFLGVRGNGPGGLLNKLGIG